MILKDDSVARRKASTTDAQIMLPLGAKFVDALQNSPVDQVRSLADTPEAKRIFDAVHYMMEEESLPNFMHSALCAMSLPVKAPKDQTAPVIRQDGNISLIIQPMDRQEPVGPNGEFMTVNRGVPYGRHARLIMIYIMTEAVRTRTREIYLGSSFSSWLRRMGITNTSSGGKRGTRTSVQDQIDRILNCQWTIRWDDSVALPHKAKKGQGGLTPQMRAFAVNDMRIVNQYAGLRNGEGTFVSHFVLSEEFYGELLKHSVPFNERAIVALKDSATKLDLYTWLAYRLPRIPQGSEVRLNWSDLAKHLGNQSSTMTKFRQSVRAAWEEVSGVYQQARHSVDMSDLIIRLRYAEKPTKGMLLIPSETKPLKRSAPAPTPATEGGLLRLYSADKPIAPKVEAALKFPASGALEFAAPELHRIGCEFGSNNSVMIMADAFRKLLGAELETLQGDALKARWQRYVAKWPKPT